MCVADAANWVNNIELAGTNPTYRPTPDKYTVSRRHSFSYSTQYLDKTGTPQKKSHRLQPIDNVLSSLVHTGVEVEVHKSRHWLFVAHAGYKTSTATFCRLRLRRQCGRAVTRVIPAFGRCAANKLHFISMLPWFHKRRGSSARRTPIVKRASYLNHETNDISYVQCVDIFCHTSKGIKQQRYSEVGRRMFSRNPICSFMLKKPLKSSEPEQGGSKAIKLFVPIDF